MEGRSAGKIVRVRYTDREPGGHHPEGSTDSSDGGFDRGRGYAAYEETAESRIEIDTPLIGYHQHNERERSLELLQMLRDGKQIALVSDAGTPAISDPGQILVRRCREEGLAVTALPGACALITALSMSGLGLPAVCL